MLADETRKVLVRVGGASFITMFSVGIFAGLLHFDSRARLVAEGLQHNLAHLVAVGDYFQVNRQIGSLVGSAHFSGIWVYDGIHRSLIAHASELPSNFTPTVLEGQRELVIKEGKLFLIRGFPLLESSGTSVGSVVFAVEAPLSILLLLSLGLGSVFSLLSWFLLRNLQTTGMRITSPLVDFSSFLIKLKPDALPREISAQRFQLQEVDEAFVVFRQLWTRLLDYQESEKRSAKEAAVDAVARQVAHDIRSPLTALRIGLEDLSGFSEERRHLLRGAINRINDIANDVLRKQREALVPEIQERRSTTAISESHGSMSVEMLSSIVEGVVAEKELQFQNRNNLRISAQLKSSSYGLFGLVVGSDLRRLLSNLVDNSADAICGGGEIEVSLDGDETNVYLRVRDSGTGIPAEIIPKLFNRGATFGKVGGSGLGLYHAKESLHSWGGFIRIESSVNRGTQVVIQLPRLKEPRWFAPALSIPEDATIVVVDDDDFAHAAWTLRLGAYRDNSFRTVHLSRPSELQTWYASNARPQLKVRYLVDYEYEGSPLNGLELIKSLGIENEAFLVTGRFDEVALRERCELLGVGMIPKTMIPFVPITVSDSAARSRFTTSVSNWPAPRLDA